MQDTHVRNNTTANHWIKYKVSLLGEEKEGMGDQLGREATGPAHHRETLRRGDRANHPRSVYHPSEIRFACHLHAPVKQKKQSGFTPVK